MKLIKKITLASLVLCASVQSCNAGLYDWVTKENVSAAFMGGALLEVLILRNLHLRAQQVDQPATVEENPVPEEDREIGNADTQQHFNPEVDKEIVNGLTVRDKINIGIEAIAQPNSNLAVVCSLLDNGLEVNTRNANGNTLLHAACRAYNTEALDLLFTYDSVNPFIQNDRGFTPLDICAQHYGSDQVIGQKAAEIVTALLLRLGNDSLPITTHALRAFGRKQGDFLATELLYRLQANTEFFKHLFVSGQEIVLFGKKTPVKNVFKNLKDESPSGDQKNYKLLFEYDTRTPIINFVRALWDQDIQYIEIGKAHNRYGYFKGLLAKNQEIQDLDMPEQASLQAGSWLAGLNEVWNNVNFYINGASEAAFATLAEYGISRDTMDVVKENAIKLAVIAGKKIPVPGADQVIAKAIEYYRKQSREIYLGRPLVISHPEPGRILIMVPEVKKAHAAQGT